ncbi:MAG: DUF6541 family protein [Chloroflexota bacterium]
MGEIVGGRPVGQTFTARRDGLAEIQVQLATYRRYNAGIGVFVLRELPDDHEVFRQTYDLSAVEDNAFRAFAFPPLSDSAGKQFRFVLAAPDSVPGNALTAWYDPSDSYKGGTADVAGEPLAGDLAFRTLYAYPWGQVAADIADAVVRYAGPILGSVLLFTVPGLLGLALAGGRFGLFGRVALAAGTSTAILPVLLLWSSLLGVRLDATSARAVLGLPVLAAAAAAFWRMQQSGQAATETAVEELDRRGSLSRLPSVLGFVLLALALWSRLVAARDLEVGMWGDSYHHTLITQLIVERGQLPDSYLPYAPLTSFTYHYGFHAIAAFFHWITGLEVTRSVVLVGQALNALAVGGTYFLAVSLTGNRWAGVAAALAAGFLSPMPAYYLNWGRYTQLAGQTILPFAMAMTVRATDRRGLPEGVLAAILVAGVAATHFRVLAFYLVFVAAYAIVLMVRGRARPRHVARQLGILLAIGAGGALLVAPWLWNQLLHQIGLLGSFMRSAGESNSAWLVSYNTMGDFVSYLGQPVLVLGALGLAVGLVKWRRSTTLICLWAIGMLVLSNPNRFGLPGAGLVNNFAVQIALYLPASFLFAAAVGFAFDWLLRRFPLVLPLVCVAVVASAFVAAGDGMSVAEEKWALVRVEDLSAIAWIKDNTPADARFAVDCFSPPHDPSSVVGSDAGWWLPLLAGRPNTVLPATAGTETWRDPAMRSEVQQICAAVQSSASKQDDATFLKERGIQYVYLGAAGGRLKADEFLRSPDFELKYATDLVHIFELR